MTRAVITNKTGLPWRYFTVLFKSLTLFYSDVPNNNGEKAQKRFENKECILGRRSK
jgi:hypothetical protein